MATSFQQMPLFRAATIGMRHGPVRRMRQRFYLQCLIFGLIFYTFYRYSAGWFPWFMKDNKEMAVSMTNPLKHFSQTQGDGSSLTWEHAVNSKARLQEALKGDAMMLEADILLRGQGTKSQELVPIMAHPPDTVSDLTFDQWLYSSMSSSKGLKLDFKSIECVELCLQRLQEHKDKLTGPVILNADILVGPGAAEDSPLIDSQRFLRLCTSMFPESTLSLGWKTLHYTAGAGQHYTWSMVKEMQELVKKWKIKQPLTYPVRASHVKDSVTQLKWLSEVTGGSLTLWMGKEDPLSIPELAYIRYCLPKDKVYYDITENLRKEFDNVKHKTSEHIPDTLKSQDARVIRPSMWTEVKEEDHGKFHWGSESLVFRKGLLVSTAEYQASSSNPVTMEGMVEFLDIPEGENESKNTTGFEINLRVPKSISSPIQNGIKCFLGASGNVHIAQYHQGKPFNEIHTKLKAVGSCMDFKLTNSGTSLMLSISVTASCVPDSEVLAKEMVSLPLKPQSDEDNHVAVRASDSAVYVAVTHLLIHT